MGSPPSSKPRPRFGSEVEIGTSRLTQIIIESQTLIIRGLWALAPKRRKMKLPWILGLALLFVGGALAIDGSTRQFLVAEAKTTWQAHASKASASEAAPPAPVAAPPAPADPAPAEAAIGFKTTVTPAIVSAAAAPETAPAAPVKPANRSTAASAPRAKGRKTGASGG